MPCCRCQQHMFAEQPHPDTGQLNVLNAGLDVVRQARFTSRFSNESDRASCGASQDHYRRHACRLSPNSTCCVTSRHVKHDVSCESWRDVSWLGPCLFQCGGRRRSSSARVWNDIMFYYYVLLQLTNEINSFIGTNYGDHNFIHITNKVSCVSRLSRSWWRTCRACCARRDVLCHAVTCCVARHSTYDFFLYQNAWAR